MKIKLIASQRGKIVTHWFFPDGRESLITFCAWGPIWHWQEVPDLHVEAWMRSAYKVALTSSEVRRLRKHGEISFLAPKLDYMKAWLKDCQR